MAEVVSSTGVFVPRLGIDIGRVILANPTDEKRSIFTQEGYRNAEFVEGAIEAVAALHLDKDWEQIHLVSKCSPIIQARTMEVLEMHNFFDKTKMQRENVHFCLQRSDKAKIASELNLTHFVDDRIGVLRLLPDMVRTKILFFADQNEPIPYEFLHSREGITPARGWEVAYLALKETVAS